MYKVTHHSPIDSLPPLTKPYETIYQKVTKAQKHPICNLFKSPFFSFCLLVEERGFYLSWDYSLHLPHPLTENTSVMANFLNLFYSLSVKAKKQ